MDGVRDAETPVDRPGRAAAKPRCRSRPSRACSGTWPGSAAARWSTATCPTICPDRHRRRSLRRVGRRWTAAEPGDGHQLIAARGLLACAGEGDVERLQSWLAGTGGPRGLAIDAELRWLVLCRLVALGAAGEAEIEAEYGRDRTAAGAEHARPVPGGDRDAAAKAEAWQIIMEDDSLSNRLVYAAAEGFWQPVSRT